MKIRTLTPAIALGMALVGRAQETPVTLQLEQMATGLTSIVDIADCGDERLFAVQRGGRIRIVQPDGSILPTDFLNITTQVNSTGGEQGLLGLCFDPGYADNGRFYVYYINGAGNGTSRVSRFTVSADPNVADPASEEILYTVTQPYTNHNGGDIDFGPDGMLYIGFGDGGSGGDPQNYAQTMTSSLGKMIRIDVSGASGWTVPADNPFATATDTLPEIFASGLRNPWRWGFDSQTGDLWIGDVGQNAVEELDFWPAADYSGANFGWRCYEATSAYNTSGCQPASAYVPPMAFHPQSQQGWCSIIGGRTYRGAGYWRLSGRHIYTDYCGGQFYSLKPDEFGGWVRTQVLNSGITGWSAITENAEGELFAANVSNGRIYRIKEQCTAPAPVISLDGNMLTSNDAISYQWYLGATLVNGATNQSFAPTVNGSYRVLATTQTGCLLFSNTIDVTTTGISAVDANGITIKPVPANASIQIEGAAAGTVADLLDAQGRVALSAAFGTSGPLLLNTEKLNAGLYTVRLSAADGRLILNRQVPIAH
ncbi:MAG: PQQ-dependent sugar dehydrogenase [Flavobacteriales bacterium]|nr:PQQ-dependent sugar dehydrogenase [Flavobacteriales bacterium]